jgi:fatty acid desaturase
MSTEADDRDRRRTRRIVIAAFPIAALSLFALVLGVPWWGVALAGVAAFVLVVAES